jgi:transitional endoplasmic reticulum ATPase
VIRLLVGALAKVALIGPDGLIWARYPNGAVGPLDPDQGPDVDVGATILVFDNGSFEAAPEELFDSTLEVGSLATVVTAGEDEPYWVRFGNGNHAIIPRSNGPEAAEGSVVLVSGDSFVLAPSSLSAASRNGIGVIRRVEAERSLVETDHSIVWIQHDDEVEVSWGEWSTVEIGDRGIVKVVSDEPLRYRDDPRAASVVHSRFRVPPGKVTETFEGIAGLDDQIRELREVIGLMNEADQLEESGLLPIRGVLFAGESGTGKTMLARALANEAGADYFHVRGPEIASKWVNESEEMLRALMDEADSLQRAIVFFDEIDSLGGVRSSSAHEMSNKLITQFLALLDGFDEKPGRALIVGATNRPEALDPTMLRSGRFDRRIDFELPAHDARREILRATRPKVADAAIDLEYLAAATETWCSADLRALWTSAFQFARSEGRTRVLSLDCDVAVDRIAPRVSARRAQIASTR